MNKLYSPHDIVKARLCIGCGICVSRPEDIQTTMKFDRYGQLKPEGPGSWFRKKTEEFTAVCPFSPPSANEDEISDQLFPDVHLRHEATGRYLANFAGSVSESDFRMQGSSGGMVSWVAVELLKKGLIDGVAHVVASDDPRSEGRLFKYRISRNEQEIRQGARSRYYPVELSQVLQTIRNVPGRYAVVAIPCMIKAVHLLRRHDPVLGERICYTLGLFCGHMKSARFVESFAWQMKIAVNDIRKAEFRQKLPNRPANWYNAHLTTYNGNESSSDWWHLKDGDWGAGFFMNHACNFCDDVVAETADISVGDAWVEPYSSDGRGNNVIVVRSAEILNLIREGIKNRMLDLTEKDAAFVEQTQAAGLRQRREGLSYRLTWKQGRVPVKRVKPDKLRIARKRKLIYRFRYYISNWSHRVFRLSRALSFPGLYLFWARTVNAVYYGVAYHNGSWREIKKRFRDLRG